MARPPVEDQEQADLTEHPFVNGGAVYVYGQGFQQWLLHNRGERVSHVEFGRIMRAAGCEPERRHVRVEGRRTTLSTWRVPDDLDP